jgi:hypothetical protein
VQPPVRSVPDDLGLHEDQLVASVKFDKFPDLTFTVIEVVADVVAVNVKFPQADNKSVLNIFEVTDPVELYFACSDPVESVEGSEAAYWRTRTQSKPDAFIPAVSVKET